MSEPLLVAIDGRAAPESPEDARLRVAFAAGDREAFRQLVEPHLDALYTMCLRLTRDPAVAQDLAQDTLVKVLHQADRYDPARAFRPWLLKIGLNLCRDKLRTVWWKRVLSLDPFGHNGDGSVLLDRSVCGPEEGANALERDRMVREALATLPAKYRVAVTLFHLEDMTYAEMAEITGVNVPALKQRVRRGCVMLKEGVERMYPELRPDRT